MTEIEQQRKIRHRLAVLRHAQEVTGSVSKTCRYYGISRPTFSEGGRRQRLERGGRRTGAASGGDSLLHMPQVRDSSELVGSEHALGRGRVWATIVGAERRRCPGHSDDTRQPRPRSFARTRRVSSAA